MGNQVAGSSKAEAVRDATVSRPATTPTGSPSSSRTSSSTASLHEADVAEVRPDPVPLYLQRPRHDALLSILLDESCRPPLSMYEQNTVVGVGVQCGALPFNEAGVKHIVVLPRELDTLVRLVRRSMHRLTVKPLAVDWLEYAGALGATLDILYTLKSYREQRGLDHAPRHTGEALMLCRTQLRMATRALHHYGSGRTELPSDDDATKEAARRAGCLQLHDMLHGYWLATSDGKTSPKPSAADKQPSRWRVVLTVEQTRLLRRAVDAMTLTICRALCSAPHDDADGHELGDLLRAATDLGAQLQLLRQLRPQCIKPVFVLPPVWTPGGRIDA